MISNSDHDDLCHGFYTFRKKNIFKHIFPINKTNCNQRKILRVIVGIAIKKPTKTWINILYNVSKTNSLSRCVLAIKKNHQQIFKTMEKTKTKQNKLEYLTCFMNTELEIKIKTK